MTFCSNRILVSKIFSEIVFPSKTHTLKHHNKKLFCFKTCGFCEDLSWFPGMFYLTDYIGTTHTVLNFIMTRKLISTIKKKKINRVNYF